MHHPMPERQGAARAAADLPEVGAGDIDLMLVPGLAFDGAGHRLGTGGGYYDEWLEQAGPARPHVVGLAYAFQVVDACPSEPRDQTVDAVVTAARVLHGLMVVFARSVMQFAGREAAAEVWARAAATLAAEAKARLEKTAALSQAEARAQLFDEIRDEARLAAVAEVKRIEDEARAEAENRSKTIISAAIQRYAGEYVAERTVATVPLPSDDMKGRIIGREGRNIRAIEAATGIALIIDATPEAVVISCYNPVRREIARLALTRLLADGRIHPTRIEESVEKAPQEVDQQCRGAGEKAILDLGIGRLHTELVRLVGRLKFRSSNAQNLLQHSIEVGILAGAMAAELGLPVKVARRAGLLHDIGMAIDQEAEGPHAIIGAQMAKKLGESPRVVHAIAAPHGAVPPTDVIAHLVAAAN